MNFAHDLAILGDKISKIRSLSSSRLPNVIHYKFRFIRRILQYNVLITNKNSFRNNTTQ